MQLDVIRDILDKLLVDRDGTMMGRADGVVLAFEENEPPVVDHLQLGATVLARRIHPGAERLVAWFRRRFPIRPEAIIEVPWSQVAEVSAHDLKLDVDAEWTGALAWDDWLREHIVSRIPGSGK